MEAARRMFLDDIKALRLRRNLTRRFGRTFEPTLAPVLVQFRDRDAPYPSVPIKTALASPGSPALRSIGGGALFQVADKQDKRARLNLVAITGAKDRSIRTDVVVGGGIHDKAPAHVHLDAR